MLSGTFCTWVVTASDSLSYVLTDYWFKCSAERIASLVNSKGGQNAFVYRYQHKVRSAKVQSAFTSSSRCATTNACRNNLNA